MSSSAKKRPSASRSRSRTATSVSGATTRRSTIRVRNPSAGVVYHLVFEGSLRKLKGGALARHLAAVSGVPEMHQMLFTEEGKRVRPEDDGRSLGLTDGSMLTLQLPEESLFDMQRDAPGTYATGGGVLGQPTGHPPSPHHQGDEWDGRRQGSQAGSSVDAWRNRRAQSPAYTHDDASLPPPETYHSHPQPLPNFPRDRHGAPPEQEQRAAPVGSTPWGEDSPYAAANARTDTYSGGDDAGTRLDASYAEPGDMDAFTATPNYQGGHKAHGRYTSLISPQDAEDGAPVASPNPHPPAVRTRDRAAGGPPHYVVPQNQTWDPRGQRLELSHSAPSTATTAPSPADERDIREDFSRISSSPQHRTGGDGGVRGQHRHHHHHTRRRHRTRDRAKGAQEKEEEKEMAIPSPRGVSPREGSRAAPRHSKGRLVLLPEPDVDEDDSAGEDLPSRAFEGDLGGAAPGVVSVLAGVTPEEQALMTADELAELLAEREYVWAMEQQRFRTEREHHARELRRRERELLYEAELLARQHAEVTRETERERRRLAELQAARALPSPPEGTPHSLLRGTGGAETDFMNRYGLRDDAASTASVGEGSSIRMTLARGPSAPLGYRNREAQRVDDYPTGEVPRHHTNPSETRTGASVTPLPSSSRPASSARAAVDVAAEQASSTRASTPMSITRQPRKAGFPSGIQVLGMSRSYGVPQPSLPRAAYGDGPWDPSPLPQSHISKPSPLEQQQQQQQQPMSLFYSHMDGSGGSSRQPSASPPNAVGYSLHGQGNQSLLLRTDLF